MTITEFEKYKILADKVLDLLIQEKHSSLKDIKILYNIIMGFPYCLDEKGQYTYNREFYNSLKELPDEAKQQLLYHT